MRLLPLLLLLPSVAFAATDTGLHYNNVTVQHVNIDFDELDVDADGVGFSFSRLVSNSVFITSSFASIETDTIHIGAASGTIEETDLSLSVGGRTSIADHADFVGSVGFVQANADATGDLILLADDSDTGLAFSAGIRALAAPSLEVSAKMFYVDIFDETATSFGVSGIGYLTDRLGIGFGYLTGDNSSSYTIGIRYSY